MRAPLSTWSLLGLLAAAWVAAQGAGLDALRLVESVCNLGLVAAELTHRAAVGTGVALAPGLSCVVDQEPINWLTPLTSMFLHGSWAHLLGNALFLWVFGRAIEDSMGRLRFVTFYLLCGLGAALAQVLADPSSVVPMVGASGAISGVMGAYLVLYPRVRVRMLFFFGFFARVLLLPAWSVLLWWFAVQVLTGLPSLLVATRGVSGGVAVWAHVGGFVAGALAVRLFARSDWVLWHRLHRRPVLRRSSGLGW